ncbi:extracellular solute-binding protein [Methylovirgula sp. 4M-Z18]|uniref:extracellular solute-binding protein n=1 Tax=Methylovirgula sp. 4M-Z18 TaxID=2293567 RepID=UPI001314B9C3|nr:extracellular solute-binding protein [Methylovirgula sp. 4M-Z18]
MLPRRGFALWRRAFRNIGAAILASAPLLASAQDFAPKPTLLPRRTVHILAWADYFDPAMLARFERETQIQPVYDTYSSGEALDTLLAKDATYDVIVLGAPQLAHALSSKQLQPLASGEITATNAALPELAQKLAGIDPGHQYGLPYQWFVTGLAYRDDADAKGLRAPAPISFDALTRFDLVGRYIGCGIQIPDAPDEVMSVLLLNQKGAATAGTLANVTRLMPELHHVRSLAKYVSSSDLAVNLANGDVCLALANGTDVALARAHEAEAGADEHIRFLIPPGTAPVSIDSLAIARSAPHRAEAYALLNFLLRGDVAAKNSAASGLASALVAAQGSNDASLTPSAEVLRKLPLMPVIEPAAQDYLAHEWAKMKVGVPAATPAGQKVLRKPDKTQH